MARVAVAEEQRDDDSLDALVEQRRRGLARIGLAQRQRLAAEHVDPPPHAVHPLARDERLIVEVGCEVEAVGVGVAEVGLDRTLDSQVVLLPGADDETDPAALPRQQAVEHRRAGEDAGGDVREGSLGRRAPLLERVLRRAHEARRLVLGSGLRLADHELARGVDDERVGHRAAGVDRQHAWVALAHSLL